MQLAKIHLKIFVICALVSLPLNYVFAASKHFAAAELAKPSVFKENDFISLKFPAVNAEYLDVYVMKDQSLNLPENLEIIGDAYSFYVINPNSNEFASTVEFKYQPENSHFKQIYLWQPEKSSWKPLISFTDQSAGTVSAEVAGKQGKVVLLEDQSRGYFSIDLPKNLQNANFELQTKILTSAEAAYPETKKRLSPIYQFELFSKDKSKLDLSKPLVLNFPDSALESSVKTVYYWDNNKKDWQPLPTGSNVDQTVIQAIIHLPFARVALFEETEQWVGQASWYAYKNGLFAASRDFPKGTKLKVTNVTVGSKNFGKSIVVTVNDYGPQAWTKRLIDLDKAAYQKIGYLSGGVMPVKVEVVK